jgi:DNA polymerase-3 subunit gamma/tau
VSLYQKYRAKSFSQIITQDHVTNVLVRSIKNNNFSHSYLFVGTRGSGKTSIARIFARAINCENKRHLQKTGEPCNKCRSCLLSLSSNHPDIIEMDAASNRGIEEVRSIKEAVEFMPSIGNFKVYIIDEVHMMTKEAFNALLKILEEPPKHVVFLMATTEILKIPPTIISRSQVYELKHASQDDIVQKIKVILENEKRNISDNSINLIAKLGKGSFRDTETILEKILNSSDKKSIDDESIISILGVSQAEFIDEIKNLLYEGKIAEVILNIDSKINTDDWISFNQQMAESVYEDILKAIKNNQPVENKLKLFQMLCEIESDLRNTSNQKLLYMSKLSSCIQNLDTPAGEVEHKISDKSESYIPLVEPKYDNNNPASILRVRSNAKKEKESPVKSKSIRKITKFDFLSEIKDISPLLYKFFNHKEFEIAEEKIIVFTTRKLEIDLLNKTSTKNAISKINEKFSVNLQIIINSENSVGKAKNKKVSDLTNKEIEEILKQS